jgi:membrane-associated protease RseP (regulator of RpoE activity)
MVIRQDLTNFAAGIMQDLQAVLDVINLLAPVVPTGATDGLYNKFDDAESFVAYARAIARRAVGGQANTIELLGTTGNFAALPFGLRISIDQHERNRVASNPAGNTLLEQAKTRTLMINSAVAQLHDVITTIKAAVAATAGKGSWAEANVDPIQEINDLIKAVWLATGIVPNNVAIDFGAWCVLSGNKNVLNRMPGADVAAVTPIRIQGMLVNPNAKITIVETAINTGGGKGNASATRVGAMGGSVLAFNNSANPTQYDPSFCKTFSPSAQLFTQVGTYREEPHLDWYENDWTSQVVVVSSGLCKRIDVTGATT